MFIVLRVKRQEKELIYNVKVILLDAINDLLDNYYDRNDLKELYEIRQEQDTNNNDSIKALQKEKEDLNKKINNNFQFLYLLYYLCM